MSLTERAADIYCQRVLGIRPEFDLKDPNINLAAITAFTLRARIHVLTHHSIIDGYEIPTTGRMIAISNHNRKVDVYKGWEALRRVHRMPHTLARKSLLSQAPDAQESQEFLESIGSDQDEVLSYNPISAWVLRNSGSCGINREKPGHKYIKWFNKQLEEGRVAALFIQESRKKHGRFESLQPGAADLAMRNPETPIYFFVCSGPPDGPDTLTVAKPTSYAEAVRSSGKELNLAEFTVFLGDVGIEVAPPRIQEDWWERTRAKELERLTIACRRKKLSKVLLP